jgi:HD-GYP domain-containing protein (c-di-GMP phosphodiesterase class II)
MNSTPRYLLQSLNAEARTLNGRLKALHQRLLETVPAVDRIACALYDPSEDLLKTFINSTRHGQPIAAYEYPLSASKALSQLASSGEFRVLQDIEQELQTDTVHTSWLRSQGYRSSFTVPLYDGGQFIGFVFFDSTQPAAFEPTVQRDLVLYTSLIGLAIVGEISALRAMLEATRVARELTAARDFETGAHLERMARYSRVIARAVAAPQGQDDEFVESVYLFASLHDIGKIGIPDSVLLKKGRHTPEETTVMRTHVALGVQIIDRIVGDPAHPKLPDSSILRNIVQCHHEYLDGSGYPQGLRGEAIPLEARIVTVADIFDALTGARPYKARWSVDQALAELDAMVQAHKLDPQCVQALHQHRAEVVAIHEHYADPDGPA